MDTDENLLKKSVSGGKGKSGPGEVDALDLVEAIRSASAEGRTGTLVVAGPDGQQRQMHFQDGLIKMVSEPSAQDDSLEQALLGSQSFSREEIDSAREKARSGGKSLAQVLLESGITRGLDAGKLLDSVTCRETARVVGWGRVRYSFRDGAPLAGLSEPYASRLGGIDAEEILDALRRAALKGS